MRTNIADQRSVESVLAYVLMDNGLYANQNYMPFSPIKPISRTHYTLEQQLKSDMLQKLL